MGTSLLDETPVEESKASVVVEEEKEQAYVAPKPQVFDTLLGEEEKQPEIRVPASSEYLGNLSGLSYIPKPYEDLEDSEGRLDISNIVQADKSQKDRADYFCCPICANVVKDPLECSGC